MAGSLPEGVCIREARPGDEALLLALIRELAAYERLADEVSATPELLTRHVLDGQGGATALIAELAGEPVGFALFFRNFSTFLGKPGLYLEDLYVRESARGQGVGRALLAHVAGIARAGDYGRLEWSVLDWNEPAIAFYQSLGAQPMSEWTVYRLSEAGRVPELAERTGDIGR